MTSCRDPLLRRKGAVSFAPDWSVNEGFDDAAQLRARWVAQEFRGRCGGKYENFSETPDLASVKAVIAHAGRPRVNEEKRDTFVELPDYVPAEFRTTYVGKLRKTLHGTRPAAA